MRPCACCVRRVPALALARVALLEPLTFSEMLAPVFELTFKAFVLSYLRMVAGARQLLDLSGDVDPHCWSVVPPRPSRSGATSADLLMIPSMKNKSPSIGQVTGSLDAWILLAASAVLLTRRR